MKKIIVIIAAVFTLSVGTAYAFNGHLSHGMDISMPHFNLFHDSNCGEHH
ncbi:hypothetical protein A6E11_08625 [Aliivibrio fischeri]|nr:hypothetical protein A6E11_08625 [Aliivibrio fischeri]OCH31186.1 hypothetical protein A6E13_17830 [Aliivibrio fischeri]OCH59879.1 hypothetical protein A6D98_02670 [Aliivibrio fischeri]